MQGQIRTPGRPQHVRIPSFRDLLARIGACPNSGRHRPSRHGADLSLGLAQDRVDRRSAQPDSPGDCGYLGPLLGLPANDPDLLGRYLDATSRLGAAPPLAGGPGGILTGNGPFAADFVFIRGDRGQDPLPLRPARPDHHFIHRELDEPTAIDLLELDRFTLLPVIGLLDKRPRCRVAVDLHVFEGRILERLPAMLEGSGQTALTPDVAVMDSCSTVWRSTSGESLSPRV